MTNEDKNEIINVYNNLKQTIEILKNDNQNGNYNLKINLLETKLVIFESEHGDIIHNQMSNEHLQVSFKCPITNAYNHKYFNEQVKLIKLNDTFQHLSVAIIKVNDLFNINNRYGYKSGDQVLRTATDHIFSVIKNNDNIEVAKFYGSEFRLLFYHLTPNEVYGILFKIKKVMTKTAVEISNNILVNYKTTICFASKQNEKDNIEMIIDRAFKTAMSITNNTEDVYIAEENEEIMQSYSKQDIPSNIQNDTTYEDIIGAFSFKVKDDTIAIAGTPMVVSLNDTTIYYGE